MELGFEAEVVWHHMAFLGLYTREKGDDTNSFISALVQPCPLLSLAFWSSWALEQPLSRPSPFHVDGSGRLNVLSIQQSLRCTHILGNLIFSHEKECHHKAFEERLAIIASMPNSKLTQAQCSLSTFAEAEGQIIYSWFWVTGHHCVWRSCFLWPKSFSA